MEAKRYEMEELIPVAAMLAGKFTHGESTSVSYERAEQLMEAVLYCIEELEDTQALQTNEKLDAAEAYELGYRKVRERTARTLEQYNAMIPHFCSYGNENYEDTVKMALPGFFRFYDARFAPQETVITMDYPTLWPVWEKRGIRAISCYVEGIALEQKFLGTMPETYVRGVLMDFQEDYQKHFFNICNVVLRHILMCLAIGKNPAEKTEDGDAGKLYGVLEKYGKEGMVELLEELLGKLIEEKYQGDEALYRYLKRDVKPFAAEIYLTRSQA